MTSGTTTELKTGYIKAKDKNLVCEADGQRLVIYGKREEILNITSVYTALKTEIEGKFTCELSPDTYRGVSFDPPDDWSDGAQIFKYDPDVIAFLGGSMILKEGGSMKLKVCGIYTEVIVGVITIAGKKFTCYPDGTALVICGGGDELLESPHVWAVRWADKWAVRWADKGSTICFMDEKIYSGMNLSPSNDFPDGAQIFKYNPDIITF